MEGIGKTVKDRVNSLSVDSKDKSFITVNSNNSLTVEKKIESLLEEEKITPEGVAKMISEMLDDKKSETYFILLVKEHGATKMLGIAHYVKDVAKEKMIRNKALYFMAILKNQGLKTKFKKEENEK